MSKENIAKLYKLLDAAEKAAAKDPDKRALAHVKRDREFFEKDLGGGLQQIHHQSQGHQTLSPYGQDHH